MFFFIVLAPGSTLKFFVHFLTGSAIDADILRGQQLILHSVKSSLNLKPGLFGCVAIDLVSLPSPRQIIYLNTQEAQLVSFLAWRLFP